MGTVELPSTPYLFYYSSHLSLFFFFSPQNGLSHPHSYHPQHSNPGFSIPWAGCPPDPCSPPCTPVLGAWDRDYLQLRVLSKFTRYIIFTYHTAHHFMNLFLAFIESNEPDTIETVIVSSAEPDLQGESGPGCNPLAPATRGNVDLYMPWWQDKCIRLLMNLFAAWMFSLYVTLLWTKKLTTACHNGKLCALKQQSCCHALILLAYTTPRSQQHGLLVSSLSTSTVPTSLALSHTSCTIAHFPHHHTLPAPSRISCIVMHFPCIVACFPHFPCLLFTWSYRTFPSPLS